MTPAPPLPDPARAATGPAVDPARVRPVVLALAPPAPGISRGTATPCLELLGGSRLIERLLGTLDSLGLPSPVVIAREDAVPALRDVLAPGTTVLGVNDRGSAGGRREALRLALDACEEELLLVHDAERALAPASVIAEVLGGLDAQSDAVVPAVAMTDSVKEVRPDGLRNVDRSTLAGLQSPRLFRRAILTRTLATAADDDPGTHPAPFDEVLAALDHGARIRTVHGSHAGFAVRDRLTLWQAQISLGLARDTSHRQGLARRS
ncbi:IspD/TarI family cytidylyltransferase [Brachybacterium aquaticum]|uniref:2-C-methyl-D-erythritol 4-phosphate cytidylyltransferase n=1 Tax=Brachybacterium aquaticum TaxID=1432564 RepID=A0A841ADZ7_9MICO|nr:2-C-methyl-D-erythritol 4-phosphate cytidylyltransferase [Brachybacterium aquaticum]MBB5832157.1 2-C-methyl-D-erythritol 4-phosphate cytidylyltransferase [Brachybacterium aquaticum]